MVCSVTQYGPRALKELKNGQSICILYKPTPTSEGEVIASNFPKNVAKAFSSKWSEEFPALNRSSPGQSVTAKSNKSFVTITGGKKSDHKMILKWMIQCCDGSGLRPFKDDDENTFYKPFSRNYILCESTKLIGCGHLENEFQVHMGRIAARQIHSEDIREMWKQLPASHDLKPFLGAHVATLLVRKELRTPGPYFTLREELPEFDDEVNKAADQLIAERRKKNKEEHEKRITESANNQAERELERAIQTQNQEDAAIYTKLSLPVVRTDNSGRTWARLDLAQAKIGSRDYTGHLYRGAKSRRRPQPQESQNSKGLDRKKDEKKKAPETKDENVGEKKGKKDRNTEDPGVSIEKDAKENENSGTAVKNGNGHKKDEAATTEVITLPVRKAPVPGADLPTPKNRNARRRAKARAAAADNAPANSLPVSKGSSNTLTQESEGTQSTDWAEEMDCVSKA